MHFPRRLALIVVTLAALGCGGGGSDESPTADVEGTVTLDGQPLEQGTITFYSTEGRPGYAKIEEGRIVEPRTYGTSDGVPVGQYPVSVSAIEENPANPMDAKWLIPKKYGNPETSGLEANVESGKTNTLTLELQSK